MKEYEKISIIIFASSFLFNFINCSYLLFFLLFSIILIYVVYIDNKKYIYLFFLLPPLVYPIFNYNLPLKEGEIYKFNLYFSNEKAQVLKVGLKNINEFYILKDSSLDNFKGRYRVEYKVEEIKKFGRYNYIAGHLISIRESRASKFSKIMRKKLEATAYSGDLEYFSEGVLLGDRDSIPYEMKELFRKTGASHLLAISGLHFGIIMGVFLVLFSLLPISYRWRYIATLGALSFFAYIIQFSPSVQRAYIMSAIFLFSKIFFEKAENKKSLALSFNISLLLNYHLLQSISFQMSYMALFGILYLFEMGEREYINLIKCSLMIQIALSPIFIYYFSVLPVFSFLSNVFLVFIGSFIIMCIYINLFLSFVFLDFIFKFFIEYLYDVMNSFLILLEKAPLLIIDLERRVSFYFFMASLIFILIYPFISKNHKRHYPIILIVFVFCYYHSSYKVVDKDSYFYFPKERLVLLKEIISKSEISNLEKKYKPLYIFSVYGISNKNYVVINEGDNIKIGNININRQNNKLFYEEFF